MRPDAATAKRFLLVGATILPIGLGLSAIGQGQVGSIVTILGLAVLIAGLHTFGRAGPDPGA
jgi:hypothetical protein